MKNRKRFKESTHDYLDFAIETAREAGQLTLDYFQKSISVQLKKDLSPVTDADRRTEELIRTRIEHAYPEHAIIGEEFGASGGTGKRPRWIIDPIDGTRSFIRGIPTYGVLIALEIDGHCIVGVVYLPALGEMVAAAIGEGCWWDDQPARVSSIAAVEEGILVHANAASFEKYGKKEEWNRLQHSLQHCIGFSDAYGYVLVATGRAEVAIDPFMREWDCGPFPAIFSEAGGYFGDWRGNRTIYGGEGMATSQRLLPEVLRVIQGNETGLLNTK